MKEKCNTCNTECCFFDKREGTVRYSIIVPHGQGVHWCKKCEDGYEKKFSTPLDETNESG